MASIFAVLVLVAVPAPAAAHDGDCVAAVHVGPVKVHQGCSGRNKNDDSNCVLNANVGPVHQNILCD